MEEALKEDVDEDDDEPSVFAQNMGLAFGLFSALTMGVNSVYNRKLKNLDYYVVMCYHGLLGSGLAILIICI